MSSQGFIRELYVRELMFSPNLFYNVQKKKKSFTQVMSVNNLSVVCRLTKTKFTQLIFLIQKASLMRS